VEFITEALNSVQAETEKPTCIVLDTAKGQGVPPVESIALNHHFPFEGALMEQSIAYVNARIAELEQGGAQ